MSDWLSKDLTLDLLAIGIHSLNKIHQRIAQEPGEWPSEKPPAAETLPAAEPELKPATEEPAPQEPQPEPEQEPETSAVDIQALKTEAQTLLRTISQTEGTDWITGGLFPHFGVNKFTDVPDDKLQELIDMATTHTEEASAA